MQAFIDWLNQLQLGMVWDYAVIIAASMLCIMFHEVSHGVVALKLGDPTAWDAGRLTFNPIKHVDIWGLLMMAIWVYHYIYGVYGDFERGSCGIQCNSHSASGRQQGIKLAAAPERLL